MLTCLWISDLVPVCLMGLGLVIYVCILVARIVIYCHVAFRLVTVLRSKEKGGIFRGISARILQFQNCYDPQLRNS